MTEKRHIFISYPHTEAEFAAKLATDLRNQGVDIWMDRLEGIGIEPGEKWRQAIQQAINESTAIIAVLSPDYVESDWCRRELSRADTLNLPIIPVRLENIPEQDWPIDVQLRQYIDFHEWRKRKHYDQKFVELAELLKDTAPRLFGELPDPEVRYLNDLISKLEGKRGVTHYVGLAAKSEASYTNATRTQADAETDWGLGEEFTLLGNMPPTTESEKASTVPGQLKAQTREICEDIQEFARQHPRFVIIGPPGAGKSTTLAQLALDSARRRLENPRTAPLPVLVELATWPDEDSFWKFLNNLVPFEANAKEGIAGGNVLLYLDGLNEMGATSTEPVKEKGSTVLEKIKQLQSILHSEDGLKHVIVTCREAEYNQQVDLGLPTLLLSELDEHRIRQFVRAFLGDDAGPFLAQIVPSQHAVTEPIYELARNPYLLVALMRVYHLSKDRKLPRNIGMLFQKFSKLLWKREKHRRTAGWVPFEEMEAAFSRLAFTMILEDKPTEVPIAYVLKQFEDEQLMWAGANAIFIEIEDNNVRFSHQAIQEYFAAVELKRYGLKKRLKRENWFSWFKSVHRWDQTIIALCGIADDVDSVVCEVSSYFPHLAALSIDSGPQVSEQTFSQVVNDLIITMGARGGDYNPDGDLTTAYKGRRRAAIDGLTVLKDRAVPILIKTLEQGSPFIAVGVAEALGQIGAKSAVPALRKAQQQAFQAKESFKIGHFVDRALAMSHKYKPPLKPQPGLAGTLGVTIAKHIVGFAGGMLNAAFASDKTTSYMKVPEAAMKALESIENPIPNVKSLARARVQGKIRGSV